VRVVHGGDVDCHEQEWDHSGARHDPPGGEIAVAPLGVRVDCHHTHQGEKDENPSQKSQHLQVLSPKRRKSQSKSLLFKNYLVNKVFISR